MSGKGEDRFSTLYEQWQAELQLAMDICALYLIDDVLAQVLAKPARPAAMRARKKVKP